MKSTEYSQGSVKPGVRYDLKAGINRLFLPDDLARKGESCGQPFGPDAQQTTTKTNQGKDAHTHTHTHTHTILPSGQELCVLCF